MVKVDVSPSGTVVPVSVAGLQVYTTSTDNMEVYSSTGLLQTGITLTSGAASNYMLYHDVAPSIVNALANQTNKIGQTNDVIGKYTITNAAPAGGRTMTFATSTITVSIGGSYSASSTVTTFKLYDESDTLIASKTGTVGSATTSLDVVFGPFTTTQEIAAGSSKTYTIKADTSNIRTGVATGSSVNLSTKIGGSKGYTATAGSGPEYFWNTGNVVYSYTPANGGTLKDGNTASDSYQVDGASLTY